MSEWFKYIGSTIPGVEFWGKEDDKYMYLYSEDFNPNDFDFEFGFVTYVQYPKTDDDSIDLHNVGMLGWELTTIERAVANAKALGKEHREETLEELVKSGDGSHNAENHFAIISSTETITETRPITPLAIQAWEEAYQLMKPDPEFLEELIKAKQARNDTGKIPVKE